MSRRVPRSTETRSVEPWLWAKVEVVRCSRSLSTTVVAAAFVTILCFTVPAAADNLSLELGFLFTEHYGVSEDRLRTCVSVLGEDDLLVAMHLMRITGMDFETVARWRRSGLGWDEITRRCRRDCSVYRVEFPSDAKPGKPYKRGHAQWRKDPYGDLTLSDDEIHAFVLVRALAEHAGLAPIEVVRLRKRGDSPREIAAHGRLQEDMAPPAGVAPASADAEKCRSEEKK
jgi:hypothetical protein